MKKKYKRKSKRDMLPSPVTVRTGKNSFIYFGWIDGVIRWVGHGGLARIAEALNGNHTCAKKYKIKFDEVTFDPIAMTKEEAKLAEERTIKALGRQLLNKTFNPFEGDAAESMKLNTSKMKPARK
jgi:hypothetical protein